MVTTESLRQCVAAQLHIGDGAKGREAVAEEPHRVRFQRQAGRHVVLDDMLGERHGGEHDFRLGEKLVAQMRREQRQRALRGDRSFIVRSFSAWPGADHVEPSRRP